MDVHKLRDDLKKLRFIDRQDWMSELAWRRLRDDPFRFFIAEADEDDARRLWDMVSERTCK